MLYHYITFKLIVYIDYIMFFWALSICHIHKALTFYSTIFKTIQDLTTGKTKITASGFLGGVFKGDFFKAQSIVSKEDIAALNGYNEQISKNIDPTEAFNNTMKDASTTAQNLAKSANGAAVDINNIPKASKAAAAGLKLLSAAGNMLLYWAIAKGIQWILTLNERLEESRQKAIEAGREAAQLTKDLDGLIEQYRKLGEDGKLDASDRDAAYDIQKQINELLGDEVYKINLANGKYEDQIELLKKLQLQKANEKYADIKDAKESAESSLASKISNVGVGNNIAKSEVEAIEELSKLPGMDKYLKTYEGDANGKGKFAMFNVDTSSTEAMIASYEKMIELRNIISKSYADEIKKGGRLEDFYKNLTNEIDELSDAVTKYKGAIEDYNLNQAVITFNETEFDVEGLGKIKGAFIDSEEAMTGWITAMINSEGVSDGVQAKIIGLAQTWYPQYSAQINAAVEAQAKKVAQDALVDKSLSGNIESLKNEAKALGITEGKMISLTLAEIRFNKNNLNVSQKISALKELAVWAGVAEKKIDSIMNVNGGSSGDEKKAWADRNNFDVMGTDKEGETWTYNGTEYFSWAYRDKTTGIIYDDVDSANAVLLDRAIQDEIDKISDIKIDTPYTPTTTTDKGSSKNEALDNHLKDAERRYKVHQDETTYISELDYALKNLCKTKEEELELEEKIREAYVGRANNQIKDIEHRIDLKKNLYGEDTDVVSDLEKIQQVASTAADDYRKYMRELGYSDEIIEATDEIQNWQNTWWDAQNSIAEWDWNNSNDWIDKRNEKGDWALYGDSEYEAWQRVLKWLREKYPNEVEKIHEATQKVIDARWDNSNNWIEDRNFYNDWALFDDSEVDAWERVVKWLKEEYPDELNKIKEAEQNLFEARKEQFDKANNFANTYIDSQKTLLQSHYDVTNAIAEAQHEINKELETSMTMYGYLDEETRKLLFNQEDYNKLSKELNTIENKALRLQAEYEDKLRNSTLETVESITSEYEMQYKTLMKSYEIAKADLEIAKKKQQLNNALNERNVRMFINGQWQWVANTEDVLNAKAELADAEYAKRVEQSGLTQQESINNLTRQQNELGVIVKQFENGVIDLDEAVGLAKDAINVLPSIVYSMLSNAKSSSYSSGSSILGGKGSGYVDWAKSQMARNSANWHTADEDGKRALESANQSLGASIDSDYDPITGTWKHKYAKGTKYTQSGLALMGEEDEEFYIPGNGRLIPITQPTVGNISGGGIVFNAEQMKNLRTMWDMSNLNFGGSNTVVNSVQPQQIDQSQDNRIIINGMTVDSGSADGQALISALRRYVGNH